MRTRTLLLLVIATGGGAPAQEPSLGVFDGHSDVGRTRNPGSVVYDAVHEVYTIAGSGANMWADHDDFHFLWKRLRGNFILTARAQFSGSGVEPHRKLGWTVRSTLAPGAPHVTAAVHGDGLAALQFRRTTGGMTEEVRSPVGAPDVIQLERAGNRYTLSVGRWGDTLAAVRVADVALGDDVYVGLFVCAHNDSVVEQATFRDVRITVPAPAGFVPYRDYIGSNLEILDIATGDRTIVYRSPESLQAPNWTKDGTALIYMSGGTPRRVTQLGPSYLHGWSPDGKFLVYTGERGGEFDVYRIPVGGGEETRLTTAPGLDDGPEYSPDGAYIYFNSVRSGTMQLWRMRPDGSAQEQLTSDQYNNWFPHVSPDGKWIVFLSFMRDVAPNDHPFYKPVYLRLMPAAGGSARVIAYVYGGQGTINVPSWSPDSRRVAFVSNSELR